MHVVLYHRFYHRVTQLLKVTNGICLVAGG